MVKEMRVETHQINKNHDLFEFCDRKCLESKNLYNSINYILRQQFTESKGYKKEDFNCNYYSMNKKFRKIKEAKVMASNFYEPIVKRVSNNWKAFFRAVKDKKKNPHKYNGKIGIPNYIKSRKDGLKCRVTAVNRKINIRKDGRFKFSGEKVFFTPNNNDKNIKQARIVPSNNIASRITHFNLEIVYEIEIREEIEKIENIAGIDIGVDRLATVVNNLGLKPFAINGKPIKSINQFFNKKRAKLMNYVDGRGTSRRIRILTKKRNNKIKTYFHKASRKIVDLCLENNIDTLIIGHNKNWKQKINLGKKNNQNFVNMPFNILIKQIEYKAREYGIKVEMTEESYTSKSSFLDGDKLPSYNKKDDTKHKFSGKRVKRGLYKASDGTKINADVNGAYNIIRKKYPKKISNKKVELHPKIINLD